MSSANSLNSSVGGSSSSSSKRTKPPQRRRPASPPSMYVAYDSSRAKAPRPLPEVKRRPKAKEANNTRDRKVSESSLAHSQTSDSSSKSGTSKSKSLFGFGLKRKTSTSLSPPVPPSPAPHHQRAPIPFGDLSRKVRQQPSLSSLTDSVYEAQWEPSEASQSSLPSMYTHSSQLSTSSNEVWSRSDAPSPPSTAHSSSSSFSSMLPTPPEEENRRRQLTKASQLLGTSQSPAELAVPANKVRPTRLIIASGEQYQASRLQPASEEPDSITPTNTHYDDDPYAALERASYSSSLRLSPMIFSAPALPAPAAPSTPSPIAVVADPEDSSDSDGDAIREVPAARDIPIVREVSVVPDRSRDVPAINTHDVAAVAAAITTSPATPTFARVKRHSKSFSIGHTQRPRTREGPTVLPSRPDTPFADYLLDDGYATDGGVARDEKYSTERDIFHSAVTAGEMEFLAMARRDAAVIKRDRRQNWSGEWNQDNMQEVIHKLRCLR